MPFVAFRSSFIGNGALCVVLFIQCSIRFPGLFVGNEPLIVPAMTVATEKCKE